MTNATHFFEIVDKEDISLLCLHDRCSPVIEKPFQISLEVGGYQFNPVKPILYCVIKNKRAPFRYFLNSCSHYSCLSPVSELSHTYTPDGHNLLHVAVISGSTDCVKELVKFTYPSDYVNLTINSKNTPLHLAIICGNIGIVSALLKYGAKPLLKNTANDSPFHLALNSNIEAARIIGRHIISNDPDAMALFLTEIYCRNRTPIETFRQLKRTEVVSLLSEFQQEIEQNEPPKKKVRCSLCSNHKKLRRCHLCFENFCPRHIDMHFHEDDQIYMLSKKIDNTIHI